MFSCINKNNVGQMINQNKELKNGEVVDRLVVSLESIQI